MYPSRCPSRIRTRLSTGRFFAHVERILSFTNFASTGANVTGRRTFLFSSVASATRVNPSVGLRTDVQISTSFAVARLDSEVGFTSTAATSALWREKNEKTMSSGRVSPPNQP